jgi:hypothetical protein
LATFTALAAAVLGPADPAHAAWGSTNADAYYSLTSGSHPDWMSGVPDGTSLAAMSVPGTHETLSIHGGSWYQTQEDHGDSAATLTAQLNAGIRAIDIRLHYLDGAFTIHHGAVYQVANFDDVLTKAAAFLNAHPSETILMHLHAECTGEIGSCTDSPSTVTNQDRIDLFESKYVADYKQYFYAPSVSTSGKAAIPTLGKVRGKIVLTDFEGPHGGDLGLGLSGFPGTIANDYSQCDLATKWSGVQANLAKASADPSGMYVTYTSANCAPFGANPADMAGGYLWGTGENLRLLTYLNSGAITHAGVVMLDFPGWAPIADLIDLNPA